MKESFMYLIRSKYLGCIAILVMAYGSSINLVEVTWKDQLHHQYPNFNDYQAFMGGFSKMTGYITILVTFFLGGNIVRRFGWGKTALITPVMLMVTGVAFFSFIIFAQLLSYVVPQGSFERQPYAENSKQEIIVAGTYERLADDDTVTLPAWHFLSALTRGLADAQDIIFLIFIAGGVIEILRKTPLRNRRLP